jgi:hypothetical protein
VDEQLRDKPDATSKEIGKAIGRHPGVVRNKPAWKSREKRPQKMPKQKSVRTVPLTDSTLAVRTDAKADDRAKIAIEHEEQELRERTGLDGAEEMEPLEVLQRKYIEGANSDEKARYYELSQADKEHVVIAWKLTGDRE